jgi:hypothetical protein
MGLDHLLSLILVQKCAGFYMGADATGLPCDLPHIPAPAQNLVTIAYRPVRQYVPPGPARRFRLSARELFGKPFCGLRAGLPQELARLVPGENGWKETMIHG